MRGEMGRGCGCLRVILPTAMVNRDNKVVQRVLVTGANGFIGQALCKELVEFGYQVLGAVRDLSRVNPDAMDVQYAAVGSLEQAVDWMPHLQDVDALVHLAGVAHYLGPHTEAAVERFYRINVTATRMLAEQAAAAGVRRFVYLSSIKVNGEVTNGHPFSADDPPRPEGIYGQSKLEAEQVLHAICKDKGMELVVIRPTLVYGPNVRGNLQRLMRLINSGLPLPLGGIDNRRSMIGVGNLCDLIRTCIIHPAAPGHVFLATDGEDVSTPELIRRLANLMGRKPKLIPVPLFILRATGLLLGRREEMQRLTSSLQVDITKTKKVLGWMPPVPLDEGLKTMVTEARGTTDS